MIAGLQPAARGILTNMITGTLCEHCGHIVPFPCKDADDASECPLNDDPDEGEDE